MKHLKLMSCLLLTTLFFISCEKETAILPENAEMNHQEIEEINEYGPMSMLDILDAGIDLEAYFNSLSKLENTASKNVYARTENTNLQFYYSPEDVTCTDLPIEDFEGITTQHCINSNYLDENTTANIISPEDIEPGISFEVVRNSDIDWESFYHERFDEDEHYGPNFDWDTEFTSRMNRCGFYVKNGYGNFLTSAYEFTDLIISFSGNNVNNVSMDLYNEGGYLDEIIEIYGASDNLLGTDVVSVNYRNGTFWALESLEPISKIVIKSENYYGYEGVDNVLFGNCTDFDEDGVLNEDDTHIYSNMSEEISFGGCFPGLANAVLSNGSTMADEVDDLIAEIWAKINSGDMSRYYNPQLDFQREMTYVLAKWYRTERVITDREKTKIVRCVRSSRIFENSPA